MDILQALRMRNIFGTPPLPVGSPSNIDPQFEQPVSTNWGSDVGMLQPPPTGFSDPGFVQSPTPDSTTETPIPTVQQTPPTNGAALPSIAQKMAQMYTPESQASDKYNQMIDAYPNREDTKPGFWRSLGSAIVDYTKGPQRGQAFYDQPYQDKLTDWKNQIGPAGTAANLERNQNVNERQMSYQTASNTLKEQSQAEKERTDTANLKIKQQRADIYDWKAKHPNMKIVFPKGGNIQAIDQTTGQTIDLGVPTGSLSDADKYDLQQTNAIARIDETGSQARQTEGVKQGNREDSQDRRAWSIINIPDPDNPGQQKSVWGNSITHETMPITMGGKDVGLVSKPGSMKPETAKNKKDKEYNAASQIKNTDPELGQFIKMDSPSNGTFEITQPSDPKFFGYGMGHKGPTPEQAKRINDAIYGASSISPVASHTTSNPPNTPNTTNIPNIPKGRVAVQDNNKNSKTFGQKFTVPVEQLQSAITQGYTEVK
jgi:hypothetical protein